MSADDLLKSFSAWMDFSKSLAERLQAYLDIVKHPEYTCYDAVAMRPVEFVSASAGRTEWQLTITEELCNANGVLHGGCAATILDCLTSTPVLTVAKEGFLDGEAVSRTLSFTYLRALRPGTKVRVVCELIQAGRTLVHCRGDMLTEDGKVAVTCVHDKVPLRAKL